MGTQPQQISSEEPTAEHLHHVDDDGHDSDHDDGYDDDHDDDHDDGDDDDGDRDDQDGHLSERARGQIECFAQEPSRRSENV